MQGLRIVVKPVPRDSVQRRHLTPVRIWDPEKKTMIETGQVTGQTKAKGAIEILTFVPNLAKGRFETGLEEMVVNPFKDMEILAVKGRYLLSDEWDQHLQHIIKADHIMRQTWYEILDGAAPNYYSPAIQRNVQTIGPMRVTNEDKAPRSFIETFQVSLNDGANVFLWDHSRSRMAIQLVKNNPLVAASRDVANPSVHHWYVALEDEEELSRVEIDDLENDALFELTSLQRHVPEDRLYKLAVTLELARGEMSPLVVRDMLNRYIKTKSNDKKDKIRKFLDMVQILKEQEARFNVVYAVTQALNVNILSYDAGFLYWKTKMDQAHVYRWKSMNEFVDFLEQEYQKWAPRKKEKTESGGVNYYGELVKELEQRGIKV